VFISISAALSISDEDNRYGKSILFISRLENIAQKQSAVALISQYAS
jgi:hypothetical protein